VIAGSNFFKAISRFFEERGIAFEELKIPPGASSVFAPKRFEFRRFSQLGLVTIDKYILRNFGIYTLEQHS